MCVYLVDIETDMCIIKPRLATSYEQTKNKVELF